MYQDRAVAGRVSCGRRTAATNTVPRSGGRMRVLMGSGGDLGARRPRQGQAKTGTVTAADGFTGHVVVIATHDERLRVVQARLKVGEVPITFVERTRGVSKMSKAIVCEALWGVTRSGIADRPVIQGVALP
jgi:hypothetical protein